MDVHTLNMVQGGHFHCYNDTATITLQWGHEERIVTNHLMMLDSPAVLLCTISYAGYYSTCHSSVINLHLPLLHARADIIILIIKLEPIYSFNIL